MALYTIGDTHLSLGADKPMDVFGGAWEGYVEKLAQGLSVLRPEDTLVIAGDISWGMSLEESEADFAWLDALPGRKILMKGNHDYWWNTAAKMNRFFAESGFSTLVMGPNKGEKVPVELGELLQANSRLLGVDLDLNQIDYDVDVLVIGGGGAGLSAKIEANNAGAEGILIEWMEIGRASCRERV